MELFQALHTRRSIRKYQEKDIPADLIDKLLEACIPTKVTADTVSMVGADAGAMLFAGFLARLVLLLGRRPGLIA